MTAPRRIFIVVGAAAVLIERLVTMQPRFASPLEASFGRSLLGFNPFLHQPPPPCYPLFVGLGKLVNFFVHDPLSSLLTVGVLASVATFLLIARAFPDWIGYAMAIAAALIPLQLKPLPDAAAIAFFALTLWALRDGNRVLAGIAAASAVACVPQSILPVMLFLLISARRARVWTAFAVALAIEFLQTAQNIELRRMQAFITATIDLRRTFDPPAVLTIAILLVFAILFQAGRAQATHLPGRADVQRGGEH